MTIDRDEAARRIAAFRAAKRRRWESGEPDEGRDPRGKAARLAELESKAEAIMGRPGTNGAVARPRPTGNRLSDLPVLTVTAGDGDDGGGSGPDDRPAGVERTCPTHGAYRIQRGGCPKCRGAKIGMAWERKRAARAGRVEARAAIEPEAGGAPPPPPGEHGPEPPPYASSPWQSARAEVAALATIVEALAALPPEAAGRVARWVGGWAETDHRGGTDACSR